MKDLRSCIVAVPTLEPVDESPVQGVLTFQYVGEILQCDHSKERY